MALDSSQVHKYATQHCTAKLALKMEASTISADIYLYI